LLLIGGQNPLTSKEESFKQEISHILAVPKLISHAFLFLLTGVVRYLGIERCVRCSLHRERTCLILLVGGFFLDSFDFIFYTIVLSCCDVNLQR
jgi:hypothetical protein